MKKLGFWILNWRVRRDEKRRERARFYEVVQPEDMDFMWGIEKGTVVELLGRQPMVHPSEQYVLWRVGTLEGLEVLMMPEQLRPLIGKEAKRYVKR